MLTTDEVCELCGLPVTTLTEWVGKGIIAPAEKGGKGRGNSHRFTPMQAVGLAVAAQVHQSDRGCVPSFVGKVVEAFGSMNEGELTKRLDRGETHFVTVHQPFDPPGKPILQGAHPETGWPDVRKMYALVSRRMKEKRGNPVTVKAGK